MAEKTQDSTNEKQTTRLLDQYPNGRSRIAITGQETRVELMEKVLEMDEEIGQLVSELRRQEAATERLTRLLQESRDDSRRREGGLRDEVELLNHRNDVMSNLLDAVNDHADAVEEALVKRLSMALPDQELEGLSLAADDAAPEAL